MYGIAAAEASSAYKDGAFLTWAETAWSSARPFVISDRDVASGRSLGKSTVVQKNCSGGELHSRVIRQELILIFFSFAVRRRILGKSVLHDHLDGFDIVTSSY
ncbi:hypothetical protein PM082_015366 [Marasmius tenuissimus]|nr:hypothetical protein PM082_015366 [Marasmius tenuissimus]